MKRLAAFSPFGSSGRPALRNGLLVVLSTSILCLGLGCGDFTLFGDSDRGPCDPDPCANKANARAGTCTVVGKDDFTCACNTGYFWDDDNNRCIDPCAAAPCDDIDNAVAGSCEGVDADDFTCDCSAGFVWNAASRTCVDDPCDPDPCEDILFAVPDSCTASGPSDFTCDCSAGYAWDAQDNLCEGVIGDACDALKACLKECDFNNSVCQNACLAAWSACECDFLSEPPSECISICFGVCFSGLNQVCYECGIDCAFDALCE